MYLIESHTITKNNSLWKECDRIAFASKNLYNRSLYLLKQELETNGKMISFNNMYHLIKNEDCFKALPSDISTATLMQVNRTFMNYFKAIKSWKKNPTKFKGCPKLPNFKHKETGRNLVIFTKNVCRLKKNQILFNKHINLKVNTKVDNLVEVQVVPQRSCYKIQVCYKKQELELKENNNYMGIDLGLNNLATCTTTNYGSIIINGKPLKSINHFYNQKLSKEQSQLKKNHNKFKSNKTQKLTLKRNNKVNNYLHKSSKKIVKFALDNNISTIVIGKNKEWKQDINLGSKNNQNFVQIPFNTLINQIEYKAKLQGISVLQHEESYTSKCSALDLEPICKHESYLGKRIKRGLFKSSNNTIINSDINGSLNILRKQFGEVFTLDQIQGFVVNPNKINLNKN
jgi:putative transposase